MLNVSAARDKVVLLYPSPMATADVVLAGPGGGVSRRMRDVTGATTTRRALAFAGWRVEGAASVPGPALPPIERYVQRPENQRRVLQYGFWPGNPAVAVAAPIQRANGVDPGQPQNVMGVPAPAVLAKVLDLWAEQRKGARVQLAIDVSGSTGEPAAANGDTKPGLAKQAAVDALRQFKADDLVGLRIFSTGISRTAPTDYVDLVPGWRSRRPGRNQEATG